MDTRVEYFVQLIGTRPGWPDNMTAEEERIMTEHYYYLVDLVEKKKVILAGPCFDPVFGLIILQTKSKEEAVALMENEPSVVQGVHTYELHQMQVSLLKENLVPGRYAEYPSDRILSKEVTVAAKLSDVWIAWTTSDGIITFFSPDAHVELQLGGAFEVYFAPESPRGSEGCRILSFVPERMLSFEWNAPAEFGDLRKKHTQVILRFESTAPNSTKIVFSQLGWGSGPEWDRLYDYFDKAWDYVLASLKKRFDSGPVDWSGR